MNTMRTLVISFACLAFFALDRLVAQEAPAAQSASPTTPPVAETKYQEYGLWWRKRGEERHYHTGKRRVPFIPSDGSQEFEDIWQQIRRTMSADAKVRSAAAKELREARYRKHIKSAIPHLIDLLDDKEFTVFHEAKSSLALIGVDEALAIEAVAEVLTTGSETARKNAMSCLGEIRRRARLTAHVRLVTIVERALDDSSSEVRRLASYELGSFGPQAKLALPKLIKLLDAGDPAVLKGLAFNELGEEGQPMLNSVRRLLKRDPTSSAAYVLGQLGREATPAIEELKNLAGSQNPDVRSAMVNGLGNIGLENPAPPIVAGTRLCSGGANSIAPAIVPTLAASLLDTDPDVRKFAAHSLGQFGPAAKEAAPALARGLRHSDPKLVREFCWQLHFLGPDAEPALPDLLRLLDHLDDQIRSNVVLAIGSIGPQAKEALPRLAARLAESSEDVRSQAALALTRMGHPELALSHYGRTLDNSDDYLNWIFTSRGLVLAGPKASELVPRLEKIFASGSPVDLKHPEGASATRMFVSHALFRISPDKCDPVPYHLAVLPLRGWTYSAQAAWMIGELGTEADEAAPVLMESFRSEEPAQENGIELRRCIGVALSKVCQDPDPIVPQLAELLKHPHCQMRADAAFAIGQFQKRGQGATEAVRALLKDDFGTVRSEAAAALGNLAAADDATVKALAGSLQDDFITVREAAARALGKIDPQAAEVVLDALLAATKDEDPIVREVAAQVALGITKAKQDRRNKD
jgi:HEAT repeat protein